MNGATPMQILFRDAIMAASSGSSGRPQPITEIAAYCDLLVGNHDRIDFLSVAKAGSSHEWRLLMITDDAAFVGQFGRPESGAGKFFVDLKVLALRTLESFAVGPESTATIEPTGRLSGLSPEVVLKFENLGSISIGGKDGFPWVFPGPADQAEGDRDALIRRLLDLHLLNG